MAFPIVIIYIRLNVSCPYTPSFNKFSRIRRAFGRSRFPYKRHTDIAIDTDTVTNRNNSTLEQQNMYNLGFKLDSVETTSRQENNKFQATFINYKSYHQKWMENRIAHKMRRSDRNS